MKYIRIKSILFLLSFLGVLAFHPLSAQEFSSAALSLQGNRNDTVVVRALTLNNQFYFSFDEFAARLSLPLFAKPELHKAEVRLAGHLLKIAARNAFLIASDVATQKQSIIQMPLEVAAAGDSLYVPAHAFSSIFNSYSSDRIVDIQESEVQTPAADTSLFDITGLKFEERKNGYLITIESARPLQEIDHFIRNKSWIYLTISGATADIPSLSAAVLPPFIQQIVPLQYSTSVQIALQMKPEIEKSEIVRDQSGNNVFVSLYISQSNATRAAVESEKLVKSAPQPDKAAKERAPAELPDEKPKAAIAAISPLPAAEQPAKEESDGLKNELLRKKLNAQLEQQKKRWKLNVIVLDPGHGGNDPGTIGVIGTREKDVTLGIALKLGAMINAQLPEMNVVYTRKTDRFVELYRRGQIANENGGKLFISIHGNSMERKPSPVSGFEIYLLRPGKTEEALRIAEMENEVVQMERDYQNRYQEITEDNFILLTMAQSGYMKQSEQFSETLEQEMTKSLPIQSRGVKQAGFYVLVGASMPNVLVESGYMSNYREEKFLRNPEGQQYVAEGIFNALVRYKKDYERSLETQRSNEGE